VLTQTEKAAGRQFRDQVYAWWQRQWDETQPDYEVPWVLSQYRHECSVQQGRTMSLDLREVYVLSPQYPGLDQGRLGFVARKGRCVKCRRVAMSKTGRVVEVDQRPPTGRVVQF